MRDAIPSQLAAGAAPPLQGRRAGEGARDGNRMIDAFGHGKHQVKMLMQHSSSCDAMCDRSCPHGNCGPVRTRADTIQSSHEDARLLDAEKKLEQLARSLGAEAPGRDS